jgi:hypothetical protein
LSIIWIFSEKLLPTAESHATSAIRYAVTVTLAARWNGKEEE